MHPNSQRQLREVVIGRTGPASGLPVTISLPRWVVVYRDSAHQHTGTGLRRCLSEHTSEFDQLKFKTPSLNASNRQKMQLLPVCFLGKLWVIVMSPSLPVITKDEEKG